MRFGFVTCVQLGLACMEQIDEVGGRLDVVVTLRDDLARNKSGRVFVDDFCAQHGSELVKIRHINDEDALTALRRADLDWLFIIGWSQIAGKEALETPRKGVLGIHPTLLPIGRGRAAIPWAILKGLPETGVTLFQLEEGVDTGPIMAQERIPIASDETATTLYQRVAEAHRTLIHRVWDDLVSNRLIPQQQDHTKATTWPARKPEEGRITAAMSMEEAERLVRAVTHPYPGAFWDAPDGRRLRVWEGSHLARTPPSRSGVLIELRDGVYEAIDYEWGEAD